jgi:HEAT repeat protein
MIAENDSELNQWLEMLRSPELSDRLVAVKNLQYLGDEEATNALLLALSDESIAVQKIAISALWEIGNPVAIPAFIECLGSGRCRYSPRSIICIK